MKDFFASKGILHQTSCIETPEQNSIVERKHQHILNVTRSLLFQSKLPTNFWNFFVQHAVFLINCIPTPLLKNERPYEKLHRKLCDIFDLRIFGCLCYSSILVAHRKKLDSRVIPGVFLGFKPHTKGFIFLNLKYHKIEVSRNVIFYENCFPYLLKNEKDPNILSLPIPQHHAQTYDDINMHNDHGSPDKNDDDLCVDNNDIPAVA